MSYRRGVLREEPYIECAICGFTLPLSEGVTHYKLGVLVDAKCADEMGAQEYREWVRITEQPQRSPQPVSDQGQVPGLGGWDTDPWDSGRGWDT